MVSTILGFSPTAVSTSEYLQLIALLLGCIILYMSYRIFYPRDFGVPVKRRLFQMHLRVVRDQVAYVPLWWSNIQVQRAINSHWRQALKDSFTPASVRSPKQA